jgi:hypothetical protein
MKFLIYILIILICFLGCNTSKMISNSNNNDIHKTTSNDTIRIANDALEYEIIIIEPGFDSWLVSTAKPEGFYSQSYLETRNYVYVTEWNSRVLQPQRFNPNLYEMQIDYSQGIDYGYDVNYKLYNYFIYFQLKHKQQLGPFVPRI